MSRRRQVLRRIRTALLVPALMVGWLVTASTPALALGTLTNVSWSVSNNQAGATGVT